MRSNVIFVSQNPDKKGNYNMKRTKKFASVLLTLVMVLTMTAAAFAADGTGTITVESPVKDKTYTAYKIFDVSYSDSKDAYSYTIDSKNAWFSTVQAYATKTDTTDNGLTLTRINESNIYNVKITEGTFSAAHFAAKLKESLGSKTGTTLTEDTTAAGKKVMQASNLPLGYYFVTSSTGALCNLTTTNPEVTIHDKNVAPPFEKKDDKADVEIGETVNYTITGEVPDTTGYKKYIYKISDKMSTGLTFNNDVKVYIDGTEITNNFTLKTGADAGDKDFVLDIDVMNLTVGAKIEVKYSATVNEKAIAKIENNKATLEYSNNPDNGGTGKREDEEKVYSAKIVIDKYAKQTDVNDKSKKLAGAKFVLYKEEESGASKDTKYYKYTAATATEKAKVDWVDNKAQATEVTTNDSGAASFGGLKNGTYYLLETAAPAGYNMLEKPVTITINGANATEIDLSSLTHTEGVANSSGAVLPSTGGIGTTIFYIVGGLLVVGAGVLLIAKRRMGAEK